MASERKRGPFWLALAVPVTAVTVASFFDLEASGWERAGWLAFLVGLSALAWFLWWFDRR